MKVGDTVYYTRWFGGDTIRGHIGCVFNDGTVQVISECVIDDGGWEIDFTCKGFSCTMKIEEIRTYP